MKTSAMICAVLGMMLVVSGTAQAAYYVPDNDEIDSWVKLFDDPAGNVTVTKDTSPGDGAVFSATLDDCQNQSAMFWKAGIGHDMSQSGIDLSGYDGYKLKLINTHSSKKVMVNIFTNNGWTDDPYYEDDYYDEATWTWLDPGESVWLSIPVSAWENGGWYISKIGFQMGTNTPASLQGDYSSCNLSVKVVPEPATMSLLALGGLAALIRRKR